MNISRRKALAFGGAALTVTLVPVSFAQAASEGGNGCGNRCLYRWR